MADGLARAGFDVDLAYGEASESAFVEAIRAARIEHKSDRKAEKTGNVFIEIEQKGAPSGLSTTTAEWWAFRILPDRWIVIRTSVLKEIVREIYKERGTVLGGDYNLYRGVLVPVTRLVTSGGPR